MEENEHLKLQGLYLNFRQLSRKVSSRRWCVFGVTLPLLPSGTKKAGIIV